MQVYIYIFSTDRDGRGIFTVDHGPESERLRWARGSKPPLAQSNCVNTQLTSEALKAANQNLLVVTKF
jgi:hypothetical protein